MLLTVDIYNEVEEDYDPFALVNMGLCDASSVFIKDEPHPSRKFETGRFRCINPVSLVDQIVESCLFSEPARLLKDNLFYNGSAVGISFSDKGMREFSRFLSIATERCGQVVSDDISGFDAIHTIQMLNATVRLDDLTYTSADGLKSWSRANSNWVKITSRSLAAINGKIYSKVEPGMINSGSKDTSRRNTALRNLYTCLFALMSNQEALHVIANGDDGLVWGLRDVESYVLAAEKLGIKLRDVHIGLSGLSFCSHVYDVTLGTASLETWPKLLYSIMTKKSKTRDDAIQAVVEARYNREGRMLSNIVSEIDFGIDPLSGEDFKDFDLDLDFLNLMDLE
jgi:hypothetical protein